MPSMIETPDQIRASQAAWQERKERDRQRDNRRLAIFLREVARLRSAAAESRDNGSDRQLTLNFEGKP